MIVVRVALRLYWRLPDALFFLCLMDYCHGLLLCPARSYCGLITYQRSLTRGQLPTDQFLLSTLQPSQLVLVERFIESGARKTASSKCHQT